MKKKPTKKKAAPTPPAKPEKKARRRVNDQANDQEDRIIELQGENERLQARIEQLEAKAGQGSKGGQEWRRGKLPGEKYIKTNINTGKFKVIDKAEWDSLA